MNPKRRMRPGVDALESKLLLSNAPAVRSPAAVVQGLHRGRGASGAELLALGGQVSGTFLPSNPVPDAEAMQTLQGAGTVSPLGVVQVDGELHLSGSVAHGRATGSFTFTNARGSVTIHFQGAVDGGQSTPHTTLGRFTITGGSGTYSATAGSGIATLAETPERRPTPQPGGPTPDYIVAAMFTLTLEPAADVRRS